MCCGISVGLIRQILRGQIKTENNMDAAIERAYEWVRKQPEIMNPDPSAGLTQNQVRQHLDRQEFERHVYAKTLEEIRLDDELQMGYVYKCLGSAVLLLRRAIQQVSSAPVAVGMVAKAQLFEKLIIQLIMEGGDADTNGAAAGALLGAFLGYANLPSHWKLGLAHNDWLMAKTERLTIAVGVEKGTLNSEKDEAADGGKKPKKRC
jgi:ADP-ribosylglycohydrolase